MAIKLVIDDASLSPSLCTDFKNVGRPVQSDFIIIGSLLHSVVL